MKIKIEKFWIIVCNDTNFKIVRRNLIYGVKEKHYKKIKMLRIGDKAIFYILGKKINGIYEINSRFFEDNSNIFFGGIYPYRIKLKLMNKTKQKDFSNSLIQKLGFIKNKRKWSGYFQGTPLLNIAKEDFNLIKEYLLKK